MVARQWWSTIKKKKRRRDGGWDSREMSFKS